MRETRMRANAREMHQCLETQTLDRLGERLDQLENTRGECVSYGTTKHDQPHHVSHWSSAERLTPGTGTDNPRRRRQSRVSETAGRDEGDGTCSLHHNWLRRV